VALRARQALPFLFLLRHSGRPGRGLLGRGLDGFRVCGGSLLGSRSLLSGGSLLSSRSLLDCLRLRGRLLGGGLLLCLGLFGCLVLLFFFSH
jgi:hypothetical protein